VQTGKNGSQDRIGLDNPGIPAHTVQKVGPGTGNQGRQRRHDPTPSQGHPDAVEHLGGQRLDRAVEIHPGVSVQLQVHQSGAGPLGRNRLPRRVRGKRGFWHGLFSLSFNRKSGTLFIRFQIEKPSAFRPTLE